jgi:hypothetical protein
MPHALWRAMTESSSVAGCSQPAQPAQKSELHQASQHDLARTASQAVHSRPLATLVPALPTGRDETRMERHR